MLSDFKQFILRGNVVDLAIGFTVGAGFTTVSKSLVEDVVMPPIAWILGNTDFSNLFFLLRDGSNRPGPYHTLSDAQAAGAITLNYGRFLSNLLSFLVVGIAMFILIKAINHLYNRQRKKQSQ